MLVNEGVVQVAEKFSVVLWHTTFYKPKLHFQRTLVVGVEEIDGHTENQDNIYFGKVLKIFTNETTETKSRQYIFW